MTNHTLNKTRWTFHFLITIFFSMIFAASLYYLQFEVLTFSNDPYRIKSALFRASRMLVGYVIPSLIFIQMYHGSWKDIGFQLPDRYQSDLELQQSELPNYKQSTAFILFVSLVGGIAVYLVAAYVFVKYNIFYGSWRGIPLNIGYVRLSLVAIMAAVTDLWTRGFILLQIEKQYGASIAILSQNVVWFVIHIYEIELLVSYISYFQAIALTLFLGLAGDLIALKTRNIVGLMIGHVILNLAILLGSKGIIVL